MAEAEATGEIPVGQMPFMRAWGEYDRLGQLPSLSDDQTAQRAELRNRMDALIRDVRGSGLLADIDGHLEGLWDDLRAMGAAALQRKLEVGAVLPYRRELRELRRGGRALSEADTEPMYRGVRQYTLETGVDNLLERSAELLRLVSQRGGQPGNEQVIDELRAVRRAAEASTRATVDARREAQGEIVDQLPSDEVGQRRYLRQLVEEIEASPRPLAYTGIAGPVPDSLARDVRRITRLLERVSYPEVRAEMLARLRLHHCYAIAAAIPGKTEDAAQYLIGAFLQPESQRWALEGADFHLLLRERLPGLSVPRAFDLLQTAWTVGIQVRGRLINLADDKLSQRDRSAAEAEVIRLIGGDERQAKKSYELAWRIAKATLETSVWNKKISGNDPLAEAIYFQYYRSKRLLAARDRGPFITIDRIPGFGTSFFRGVQTLRGVNTRGLHPAWVAALKGESAYLHRPEAVFHTAYLTHVDDPAARIAAMRLRNQGEQPGFDIKRPRAELFDPLQTDQMDFQNIKPGEYWGWLSILVPRLLKAKSLLLQTTWKKEDLRSDALEGYIAPFNTADPDNMLRLRPEFVLGAYYSIFSTVTSAADQGWDSLALSGVNRDLTARLAAAGGKVIDAFLSSRQLSWVTDTLARHYRVNVGHQAAMASTVAKAVRRFV